jgi:Family of unknown function (DUF6399)
MLSWVLASAGLQMGGRNLLSPQQALRGGTVKAGCQDKTYRGLTEHSLKVLTIIRNFDLDREDGTTAAQRLFDKQFPDLFEWAVQNMGDLPRARRTLKPKMSRKPSIQLVPA